jgi:hypothetical protein
MKLILTFTLLLIAFCNTFSQNKDFRFVLDSQKSFSEISGEPLSHAFSGVSTVKLVYNLEEQKLYYVNSRKYPLHYNFCIRAFGFQELYDFNRLNYIDNPSRQYILASLNYFRDTDIFTLEFSPADDISPKLVEHLYNCVKASFFGSRLFLQVSTQKLLQNKSWNIPFITMNSLFEGQRLQIIQKGEVNGKLIAVAADSLYTLGDVKNCILLIKGSSNDIPLCKGIITTDFQTPLSHISILSQNRKTPLVAYRGASENDVLNAFLNKKVHFEVLNDTFILKVDSSLESSASVNPFIIKIDTVNNIIVPLKKLQPTTVNSYGAKAVNLAELTRVKYKGKPLLTPEGGFAIPVYYYWQHIRQNKIDTLIGSLLKNCSTLSKQELREKLILIQKSIKKASLDKGLIRQTERMMISMGNNRQGYRFRSSSNAEDLAGFNGAGLYTSETGIIGDDKKSVEKAIKKVWASLWSERAFEERCVAGIDQNTVGMAVLAHRSFPDEYANGVAITKNLYRDFYFGFVVNLQLGDNSLVKPKGDDRCEQLISFFNSSDVFFNEKDAIEYLSFSSLNNNLPILTRDEVFELTQQLECIKQYFYRRLKAWKTMEYKDFAMDVEFKVEDVKGKKVFYFKQARPF